MHVQQPLESRVCGQACLAMLAGISLEQACRDEMFTVCGTRASDMIFAMLGTGVDCDTMWERRRVKDTRRLPARCLAMVSWSRKNGFKGRHWTVVWGRYVHDPALPGPLTRDEYTDLILKHGRQGAVTVVIELHS